MSGIGRNTDQTDFGNSFFNVLNSFKGGMTGYGNRNMWILSDLLVRRQLREMEEKHRNDEEELEEPDRENPPVSLAEAFASSSVSAGEDSAEGGGSSGTGSQTTRFD